MSVSPNPADEIRVLERWKYAPCNRASDPIHVCERFGDRPLHGIGIRSCQADRFLVQVQIGPEEEANRLVDAEAALCHLIRAGNYVFWIQSFGRKSSLTHCLRRLGHPVVRGKHDQRALEAHRFLDEVQQIRKSAIELQHTSSFSRLDGPKKWLTASTDARLMER